MRALTLVLFLLTAALPASATAMSIDVARETIRVTTGFTGETITVFGVQDAAGTVAIVVEGPPRTMTLRKKGTVFGLWTNTNWRSYKGIPSFYDMAAGAGADALAAPDILRANRIGLAVILLPYTNSGDPESTAFTQALVRLQRQKGLFGNDSARLDYVSPTLFKAKFNLPALVFPGTYTVNAYVFSNGQVVEKSTASFEVVPEGISAALRRFATKNSLLYGVCGVMMAFAAGGLATLLLKRE